MLEKSKGGNLTIPCGYQCTAIALAVILFTVGNHVPSLRNWSANVVDEVMMRGHNLYEQILTESGNPSPRQKIGFNISGHM